MSGRINLADIPADVRKKLNLPAPRRARSMSKDDVRTYAIRVLNVVAELTPAERKRVLSHALKVNDV